MKRKAFVSALLISWGLAVTLSGCGLFQKPKQQPDSSENEQAAYWENPWEDLPVISHDGTGVVGTSGGVVWLNDISCSSLSRGSHW